MNRRLIKNTWSLTACAVLGTGALFAQGCGTTAATSAGDFAISGSLATTSSRVSVRDQIANAEFENLVMRTQSHMRVALDTYSVRCVTLTGTPAVGEGTCDGLGAFSLTLAGAAGNPVGCFVLSGTSIVAVMSFEGSSTGIDGSTTSSSSLVPAGGATGLKLGAITLDLTKGTATVPVAQIETVGDATPTSTATWANMQNANGWTISAIPAASLPAGVETAGPAGGDDKAPPSGMKLFFAQYAADDVTGGGSHIGLALWNGEGATAHEAYDSCTSGGSNGEGADLPAGQITAVAGPNNNASLLTNPPKITGNFADPSTVVMYHPNCGLPQAAANGTNKCSDIPALMATASITDLATLAASPNGNNHTSATTFSRAQNQCIFQCVLNATNGGGHGSTTACTGEAQVNWNQLYQSGGGSNVFNATFDPVYAAGWSGFSADGTALNGGIKSYFSGAVTFGKQPKNRFMFDELVVSGNVGSLTDKESRTMTICKTFDANNQCTASTDCHVTRLSALTITQTATSGTSATAATMQLVESAQFAPTDDAACGTSGQFGEVGKATYLFNVTAN